MERVEPSQWRYLVVNLKLRLFLFFVANFFAMIIEVYVLNV